MFLYLLTYLQEHKCDQYWPDLGENIKHYGKLNVTCVTEDQYADFTVRSFVVSQVGYKLYIISKFSKLHVIWKLSRGNIAFQLSCVCVCVCVFVLFIYSKSSDMGGIKQWQISKDRFV